MKKLFYAILASLVLCCAIFPVEGRTRRSRTPAKTSISASKSRKKASKKKPTRRRRSTSGSSRNVAAPVLKAAPRDTMAPHSASKTPERRQTQAVETPDFDQIRAEVTDPASPYFYPRLFAEYERNETIQTLADYRRLYYGYLFQEDFNPYRHSDYSTRNESLYYKSNHTRAELDSIITYAEMALQDTPFDLQQMNFLIYALHQRGKINKAAIWQFRLNHLLQAIISSGTGLDRDNAWYVVNPTHEYNILNFQNAVAKSQEYEEPYFDRILVERKATGDTATYFFNIRNLLEEYYRKYPDQE